MSHPASATTPIPAWHAQPERGAPHVTRAAIWLVLRGGRTVASLLSALATLWFLCTAPAARRASRDYLGRALGRPARLTDVARHFHSFATAVQDRVLLLAGRTDGFEITTEGLDQVLAEVLAGRGCILLGAHLGSFEVLRSLADRAPVPVWALMYRRNAGALTGLLDRLAPGIHARVLEIGDTASMIRARECVERGEIVGILADRAPAGHRMVTVPFLGAAARFPSGPFVLASTLAAPVVLFQAVRTGPRRYTVRFEPFAPRVHLRRAERAADLHAVVARYAAAVERGCRAHPFQWFNFFPFWEHAHAETTLSAAHPTAAAADPGGPGHLAGPGHGAAQPR
ncbi:MAG: acyl-CoA synthetase [Janthinobacterium lividum]